MESAKYIVPGSLLDRGSNATTDAVSGFVNEHEQLVALSANVSLNASDIVEDRLFRGENKGR